MSVYYEWNGDTVWNPSSNVGTVFNAITDSLEKSHSVYSGLFYNGQGDVEVDLPAFDDYLNFLRNRVFVDNPIGMTLIGGYVEQCFMLRQQIASLSRGSE